MHHIFTPKLSTRFAYWNVCTLSEPNKQNMRLHELLLTLKEKNMEFVALSEVRQNDQELELQGSTFLYCGPSEQQHCTRGWLYSWEL